ncbi:pyrroloquinoline quinone biosynthesis protein PqqE [Streptosporangium sp. NPDC001559]|uniref:pyrroloquinoline quinone biosynthesis protein PqqE n=1 Tax=Streptosporangium sp. NPDC001559 TaxID=3366187 RepID=UPI0036E137CD
MDPLNGPWAMLAEVTHGCPLRCPYCSNPTSLVTRSAELDTATWIRVFEEAAALGVVHAHLSGGEPLLRGDLAEIAAAAASAGVYTQLVTSGVGLTRERLAELVRAGVRGVQLSTQAADAAASDRVAGRPSFADKRRAAALIVEAGLPLGLNVVLHRHNLDAVDQIVELGIAWGAQRIELANVQFYGWGLVNRRALMPTRAQLAAAREKVERWRRRSDLKLIWVVPDYFDGTAKPCMGGWGTLSLTVAPDGRALPCPAAYTLPLRSPNVREHSLEWIWRESEAFNAYRGTSWMSEPCSGCPLRHRDFGGCRCQAFALTGDAGRTDPACSLSPDHHIVTDLTTDQDDTFVYRSHSRRVH